MKEVSQKNFGLVIAYVVPGLIGLWAISYFSDTVKAWLTSTDGTAPTVAGFLYVTLGSLACGLTIGAIRSVTIDPIHHLTGLRKPSLDFSDFQAKFWAFNQIVEAHYRYYQFYSHMAIAMVFVAAARVVAQVDDAQDWRILVALCALGLVLGTSSRTALREYYHQAHQLLRSGDSKHKQASVRPKG